MEDTYEYNQGRIMGIASAIMEIETQIGIYTPTVYPSDTQVVRVLTHTRDRLNQLIDLIERNIEGVSGEQMDL